MKNLSYLLMFVIFVVIPSSCSRQKIEDENAPSVLEKIKSKDQYLALSPEDQKQAWILKMKSYQNLNLSSSQKSLITKMIFDLQNIEIGLFYISESLKKHAISLTKITPEMDFISLFTNIEEDVDIVNSGGICQACITDLENYVKTKPQNENNDANSKVKNCNCRWTCDLLDLEGFCQSTTNCKVTRSGCGFLELYECTGGCY